ncbi:unnamed protein product [Oikopleura dioica]|uniref:Uncharacterized protein n=1 Tax=Oikopleura dioica TaxID=34765 RepID=E4Y456_OIKDI|nr:unnamed protein product [Oikopleura dioica]
MKIRSSLLRSSLKVLGLPALLRTKEAFRSVRHSGLISSSFRALENHCAICGDRATGKHYGAHSCDGCKGFFRRSIRKNHSYQCRRERDCTIERANRNSCRHCRLIKCFRAGMRREAVQNERDPIRPAPQRPEPHAKGNLSVKVLETAFKHINNMFPEDPLDLERISEATRKDVAQCINRQLRILVEWAKAIPAFTTFTVDDQVALLRAFSAEYLMIGCSQRTYQLSMMDNQVVLLSNNQVIRRDCHENDMGRLASKILDQLCETMRELGIDQTECGILRAIMFFDPTAPKVSYEGTKRVRLFRKQLICNLEDYVLEVFANGTSRGRAGEILCLIPPIKSISNELVEAVQFTKMFGLQEVDALIQEMLLSRDDTDPIFRLNSPTSTAPPRQEIIDLPPTAPQQHQPDSQGFFVTGQSQTISVQHELEPPPAKMTKVERIE